MRKALRMGSAPALWIVLLFGSAGRLDWARGWIAVAMYVVGMGAIGVVVSRANAPLMEARAKWRRAGTKGFDKVILPLIVALSFVQPAAAGLDAVRFGRPGMPFAWVFPGVALFLAGCALAGWAMAVNAHAEASVRIQTDRGHTVVSSGPYRYVRHPLYAGAVLMYAGTPLVLGSPAAAAASALMVALFLVRTVLEDRTLQRELDGYPEYAARVRCRIVPGLW
jgi:protein-S-isoprenylcysteine O-methyltransferase Ste14